MEKALLMLSALPEAHRRSHVCAIHRIVMQTAEDAKMETTAWKN
jgi:hypothetical protein